MLLSLEGWPSAFRDKPIDSAGFRPTVLRLGFVLPPGLGSLEQDSNLDRNWCRETRPFV
jgi:hypothetical protein